MEPCKCYEVQSKYTYATGKIEDIGICNGTKDCEECSCGGDKLKCDFYDYIRKQAQDEFDAEIQSALKELKNVAASPYLSRQEAIDAIIARAQTLNKKVPEELLERLFK